MSLNIWAAAGQTRNFAFRHRTVLLRAIPHSWKVQMLSLQTNAKQPAIVMG